VSEPCLTCGATSDDSWDCPCCGHKAVRLLDGTFMHAWTDGLLGATTAEKASNLSELAKGDVLAQEVLASNISDDKKRILLAKLWDKDDG